MPNSLSKTKLVVFVFIIALISLIGLSGYYYYATNKEKISLSFPDLTSSQEVSASGITFRFEVSGLKVKNFDKETFNTYLGRLGFTSLKDIPFIDSERNKLISPEKIIIIFKHFSKIEADITDGKIQKNKQILDHNGNVYYFAGNLSTDGKKLVIPTYLSENILKNKSENLAFVLTEVGLQSVFYNLQHPPLSKLEDSYQKFIDKVNPLDKPIFQINYNLSQSFLYKLQSIIQPQEAMADVIIPGASCSGSVACGTQTIVRRCDGNSGPMSGQECDNQRMCQPNGFPNGSCQIAVRTCTPTGVNLPCFTQSDPFSGNWCVIRSCLSCEIQNNCSVVPNPISSPPPPPPPPPPGVSPAPLPSPSPPPANWGACGSCNSCGKNNECRLDPTGACIWDPGGCGLYVPGCNWDQYQTGYPTCRVGEGNYCANFCNGCIGQSCADGLVRNSSNICVCPAVCQITVSPTGMRMLLGESRALGAYPIAQKGTITRVTFSSTNGAVARVNPVVDPNNPYLTTVSAAGGGVAIVRAQATATSDGTTSTCVATIGVRVNSPPTVDITANGSNGPITVPYNTAATLVWTSTNSTSCVASGGWSGVKATNSSESTGALTSDQTYILDCTGPGGNNIDSVLVRVSAQIGTIRARAVLVDNVLNTCPYVTDPAAIQIPGTIFGFTSPVGIPPQTQTGGNYLVWNSMGVNDYSLNVTVPAGYNPSRSCWSRNPGGNQGEGYTARLNPNSELTFDVGFSTLNNWLQVIGGSIKVRDGSIDVNLPPNEVLVQKDTASQNSPIVSYGPDDSFNVGSGTVSQDGYLVKDGTQFIPPTFNYYNYYYNKFGTKVPLFDGSNDPSSGVYEVTSPFGNLTISGNWNVNNPNQSVVIFVPGNLTVNTNVRVSDGSFLAFIVNGNINVLDTVGYDNPIANPNKFTDPNMTGIIITNGTFQTDPTAAARDRQYIGAGTFVANKFSLNRDLENNNTDPGELFIYRPDLWVNAPAELKEIDVVWEEVKP